MWSEKRDDPWDREAFQNERCHTELESQKKTVALDVPEGKKKKEINPEQETEHIRVITLPTRWRTFYLSDWGSRSLLRSNHFCFSHDFAQIIGSLTGSRKLRCWEGEQLERLLGPFAMVGGFLPTKPWAAAKRWNLILACVRPIHDISNILRRTHASHTPPSQCFRRCPCTISVRFWVWPCNSNKR